MMCDTIDLDELGADSSSVARLCERGALPFLLADAIGRATRPIWLGCVSPTSAHASGSLATLRLLDRGKSEIVTVCNGI